MDLYIRLKEKKLMLIDDDEFIRDSLKLFFEEEGCCITTVETAEEGLEEIKKQAYDIILVDYKLPGMNGLEFFRRIKKDKYSPIKIMITAYKDHKICNEAIQVGVQVIIDKPFEPNTLETALFTLISN